MVSRAHEGRLEEREVFYRIFLGREGLLTCLE